MIKINGRLNGRFGEFNLACTKAKRTFFNKISAPVYKITQGENGTEGKILSWVMIRCTSLAVCKSEKIVSVCPQFALCIFRE